MDVAPCLLLLAALLLAVGPCAPHAPGPAADAGDLGMDCMLRRFAFDAAVRLQPDRDMAAAWDALRLGPGCNETRPPSPPPRSKRRSAAWAPRAGVEVFVSPTGKDSNAGSLAAPLQTLHAARDRVRLLRGGDTSTAAQISLRAGTYFLGTTLELGEPDSNLAVVAYNGERAVVSGGTPLGDLAWAPDPTQPGRYVAHVTPGLETLSLYMGNERLIRGRFPDGDPERDIQPRNYIPSAVAWKQPGLPSSTNYTVQIESVKRFMTDANGMRPFYSRLVGGYADRFDPGVIEGPPRAWCNCDECFEHPNPDQWTSPGVDFAPFCAPTVPVALQYNASTFTNKTWKNPSTGMVYAFNDDFFSSLQWEIEDLIPGNNTIVFGRGGVQAGQATAHGSVWYVENILEETDSAREWFLDSQAGLLYLVPNATEELKGPFVAAQLETLVRIAATRPAPASDISFRGVSFQHAAPTFLGAYSTELGGGDYSAHHGAAFEVTNAHRPSISDCTFERLGGNAILLHGYVRNASITHSEFAWLGAHAIMSWGRVKMLDGANGDHVEGTLISDCLAHEIGVYEKQTCFYFHALSARATVQRNVAFNSARALIDINDGFAGGHDIQRNVLFNAVRETGDHGAINTWDRSPCLNKVKSASASLDPLPTHISRNVILSNYHQAWPIDHDDGSRYYNDTDNVLAWGGSKNFMGQYKNTRGNLYIRPDYISALDDMPPSSRLQLGKIFKIPYCGQSIHTNTTVGSGIGESWANNTCILGPNSGTATLPYQFDCNLDPGTEHITPGTSQNRFHTSSPPKFRCTSKGQQQLLTFAEWQARGNDAHSTLGPMPSVDEIRALAEAVLGW